MYTLNLKFDDHTHIMLTSCTRSKKKKIAGRAASISECDILLHDDGGKFIANEFLRRSNEFIMVPALLHNIHHVCASLRVFWSLYRFA
jgi:hypothetical protein